jgi:REP element-mobilizing transposase RayT
MARKPRIHYPGAFYHVILRGNAGNPVFFEVNDRSRFFLLLQEGIERYKHRIHAYCLMTNHIHLIVQVDEIPLSRIIQNLSFRYTRYVNSIRKQTGHLFQGRYKALLIDADSYLLQLTRYIHNNPVRVRIVSHPADYKWSSHPAYLGIVSVPWLTTEFLLRQFAGTQDQARKLYTHFQEEGLAEPHRNEFHSGSSAGIILGDDGFAEKAMAKASRQVENNATLAQVIGAVCKKYKLRRQDLSGRSRKRDVAEARALAALLVRESSHLSLTGLAGELGYDVSSLSQAAARIEKKIQSDSGLAQAADNLKRDLQEKPICQA